MDDLQQYLGALMSTLLAAACARPDDKPEITTTDEFLAWRVAKGRGGSTFSGSPPWNAHIDFVEDELRAHHG